MSLTRFRHLLAASVIAAAATLSPPALAWPPRPSVTSELIVGRADIIDGDTFGSAARRSACGASMRRTTSANPTGPGRFVRF